MIHMFVLPSCLESVVLLREGVVLDRGRETAGRIDSWWGGVVGGGSGTETALDQ